MTLTAPPRDELAAPKASRSRRPGWRNPRLLLGLVLVAGSVVLGARLIAGADDSVGVWALERDLPSGAPVTSGDLVRRQVRFAEATTADRYLSAERDLPSGATLERPLSAGELVPRAALATGDRPDLVEVPVSLAADDLPATVGQGSVVDVWVSPRAATTGTGRPTATQVLDDVVVVAVPRRSDSLAPQATRQVIVGTPAGGTADLGAALGGMSDGRVVIVKVG